MASSRWRNPVLRPALAFFLFILGFGLVVWANYSTVASLSDGMASQDFMSLWIGAKTIIMRVNPYDVDVWRPLRASYGSEMLTDLVGPFPMWTFMFFIPFSYLTTQAAGALWITICELSLIAGIFLLARAFGWKGYTPLILVLGIIVFRPVFPAVMNGQLVPVLFLLLVIAYIMYERGHPFTAGFLLAIQIVKPNLALFLILTLGWIFLVRREWRALAGLITGGLVLLVASWIAMPGWLFDYLTVTEKTRTTPGMPTVWGLTRVLGGAELWPASAIVAGALFYLGLLYLVWKLRVEDWLISLNIAVVAATFLTPYAWAYEQVILLLPNTTALHWGLASKQGPRWAWWAGWWLVGPIMSWLFFLYAYQRKLDVISGLMPLLSLGYFCLAWIVYRKRFAGEGLAPSGGLASP
jgi:hypothetical protein